MPDSLEELVTAVASQLMAATAATEVEVSERVLAGLVEHFGVDVSFLRHNDHRIRASRLVAQWPPRDFVPEPDPLALVYFADADPVFALSEHLKKPAVFRPEPATDDYQRLVEEGSGVPATSLAGVPLISGEVTTGTLGFVKFGDREWKPEELNALQAIAALFAQVQARIVAEDQLRYLADHDDLTGLHNRRALLAHLTERLAAGQPGPVWALFLDLDRLKAINDFLGFTAGDWFIKVFADRLRADAEDHDVIARLGGDDFFVVPAAPMDAAAAEAQAHRLHAALSAQVAVDGELLTRTVSIGVASGVPGVDTASDLLRRADQAVLAAKGGGGDNVAIFSDEMSLASALRNDIELHLQGAIENDLPGVIDNALVIHYLPEVDMRTGEILAAEALVRWQHPTRGLLLPDSFIGVAESTNLAGKLGRSVMRAACAELARWRSHGVGQNMVLRLNVSPVQLVTSGFVAAVADILNEFGIDGASVCLEVTENVVVQDIETTRKTLAGLKEVGVQIAIDDFGTGYSVLSHLKSLPVDVLKIDKGFVCELGSNADDLAIVKAIIALGEAFGLQLVAEGVETEIAAITLLQSGCHRAQGFLLSRPITGEAMESLLSEGHIPLRFSTAPADAAPQTPHTDWMVSQVGDAIICTSINGVVTSWNPAAEAIYRRPAARAVGLHASEAVGAPLDPAAIFASGTTVHSTHHAADGSARTVRVSAAVTADGYVLVCADHTAETHFQAVMARLDVGVLVIGKDGRFESVNPAAERILGVRAEDLADLPRPGNPDGVPVYDSDGEVIGADRHPIDEIWQTGAPMSSEAYCVDRPDGRRIWLSGTARLLDPGDPQRSALLVTFTDVTAQRTASERLTYEAAHDSLTGLPNRSRVLTRVTNALESSGQQVLAAVLFIDLDNLKTVNDSLGHDAGDAVLRIAARRLRRAVRSSDIVGRLGGDEFVALLIGEITRPDLDALADRIHRTLSRPLVIESAALTVGVSIGIVVIEENDERTAAEILRDADIAMYQAKSAGRGQSHYFTEQLVGRRRRRHPTDRDILDRARPDTRRPGPAGSDVIDQAIGILRSRSGASADDALDQLHEMSEFDNVELAVIAQRLVAEAVHRAQVGNHPTGNGPVLGGPQ